MYFITHLNKFKKYVQRLQLKINLKNLNIFRYYYTNRFDNVEQRKHF